VRHIPCLAIPLALIACPAPAQDYSLCSPDKVTMGGCAEIELGKALSEQGNRHAAAAGAAAQQQQAYRENLRIRRSQAEQYAAAARNGVPLPANAAETLRRELAADIEQWRAEFHVGRKDAQAMRDRWLVETDSLSAVQWAERRVEWWDARDAWAAAHPR
jgi:hypothetical protein